jgi:tetratricopeptide (TPR) repeat protein
MFLTHIDQDGNDSPAILIENATAANRAVNIPEFVNVPQDGLLKIDVPAGDYYKEFDIASDLAKKGEYEASIPEWKKAIELNPADARAYVGMGVALASTAGIREGIALYKKAIEIDPESPDAYSQMGILLARQGNYEDAIPYLSKAIELNPQDAITPGNLCGALALSKGRTREAIDYCRQAVTALPEDVQSHANLAIALANAGEVDESIAQLETASKLAPGDAAIHRNLAIALAQKGRLDEAISHLEQAMRIAPDFNEGYFYLGALYSTRGRLSDAMAQWRHLLDLQPDHVLALNSLARALATAPGASLRNGAEAVTLAERAARLSGGREPVLLDTLAAAYAEAGRFPDAAGTERQAIGLAAQSQSPQLLGTMKARLSLYESRQAFHEK